MYWRSFVVLPHPFFIHGCGYGTEDLYFASCPGVFSSGIQPRRIKQWLEPLFLESCRCRRSTARGRARSSRIRSRQVEGGNRLDRVVLDEGGREAQLKLLTQPTAGRTLVTDRSWHASVTHSGVDLTGSALQPLIRLSTHPTASARQYVSASCVLQPLLFCPRSDINPDVKPMPTLARGRGVTHALSGGWGHRVAGVVVDESRGARLSHACVSEPVSSSLARPSSAVFPIGEGPRSIGSQLE
ncbi:hypothetical protein EVAR_24308_1 [Eumeta japonica]|uniref:Uncharacterized protein n=1 Tax=Eumeta variegata TaxID=151549 RepID=A0A4C1VJP6_EUMVA|nr:hypothetical protein EVAR_24308_1 [Eumeta japonica]